MEKYGYIRVSTKDQNPERQSAAFENTVYVLKMCIWTRPPGKILKDRPTKRCLRW